MLISARNDNISSLCCLRIFFSIFSINNSKNFFVLGGKIPSAALLLLLSSFVSLFGVSAIDLEELDFVEFFFFFKLKKKKLNKKILKKKKQFLIKKKKERKRFSLKFSQKEATATFSSKKINKT